VLFEGNASEEELVTTPASLLTCCTNAMLAAIVVTVKFMTLLRMPPTVTTTFPVVAPLGTCATMLVGPQLVVGSAGVPLKATVLAPCVAPKFVPVMVTKVPTGPEAGLKLAIVIGVTVKPTPLLTFPPTVTNTLPVVAPAGTGAVMLVSLQLVGVAGVPLNVTVLVPCRGPNALPEIPTGVPMAPETGITFEMLGTTVNGMELLGAPPTVTTTLPESAPKGTGVTIVLGPHVVGVAKTPLKETVLAVWVAPKLSPVIVTEAPTVPEVGVTLVMLGGGGPTVKVAPLLTAPPLRTT